MSRLIKKSATGLSTGKIINTVNFYEPVEQPSSTISNEQNYEKYEKIINEKMLQAEKAAQNILQQAQLQAENWAKQIEVEKENLEIEKQKVLDAAYQEGYTNGFKQGEKKGELQYSEQITLAKQIIDKAKNDYNDYLANAEPHILSLALKIAEKIIHSTLENEERFLPVVKNALLEAKKYDEISIYIHPKYYSLLSSQKDELLSKVLLEKQIYLYPEEKLAETGCIIETDGVRIDASIDTQFQQLRDKLFEIIMENSNESN